MMHGRDLVFEIGTEELPSSAVYAAIQQLQVSAPKALDTARLEYGEVSVLASPRRITLIVNDLAESQPDVTERHKGPAAKAAFDADGKPTKAAEGFARGKGVDVSSLEVVDDESGSYVYATVEVTGVNATEVLPELLAGLAERIDWAKSMRWGCSEARFSRPVRWLLALYGTDVVPVEFAGLTSNRLTWGHRFMAPGPAELAGSYDYMNALDESKVIVDQTERARVLREAVENAVKTLGCTPVVPSGTFAEVVNLVEWPTVAVGTFDEDFLAVPREILEDAMTSHQRYFPVQRADGSLDNRFIVAHNGDPKRTEQIVRGHERVIRARLSDAAFFYHEDLKTPLEEWASRLESVVFQEKLGTTAEKVLRVERLVSLLAEQVGASAQETDTALRAAHLCKADLVTSAVVEFTDLQGVMGRYYAMAGGESDAVGQAIEEHYRPRFAGDELPATLAGRLVSIADKADTVCGIFSAGMAPRGSADPFALRRSAIGILQMMLEGLALDVPTLVREALAGYARVDDEEAVAEAVEGFFTTRLEGILRDRGLSYDTVDAVLAGSYADPADALARCTALQKARETSEEVFADLSIAYKRAANLLGAAAVGEPDPRLMGDAEESLLKALVEAVPVIDGLIRERSYARLLEVYASLRPAIDDFFENVLVMDPDDKLRDNRLGLLAMFVASFSKFADFERLAQ